MYDNKKNVCLHFQVDMARGIYFLSLVLMLLLVSHILAQNRPGSFKEKVLEKVEGQHEKFQHSEETKDAVGWRRRKRSLHGMTFRLSSGMRAVG